ncbi:MAG: heme NO-binding domain-containing protein [Myxococcota bacterium]
MYGMVNKAVRGFVLQNFDEATWTRIHTTAGVDENFVAMQAYDDAVTYDLVAAANAELGIAVPDILNGFGRYWVSDVATVSYAELMAKTGSGFIDFVKNLDHLHERIRVTFPDYQPPSFRIHVLAERKIQVDYYSHREGLLDFVVGLLEGLAEHFGERVSIEHVPDDSHPMPCKRMLIELEEA